MTSASDTNPNAASFPGGAEWPDFGWVEDVRPALAAALEAGRDVALATLYRVEGSSPRGPGVQMLFDGESAVGFFSGGCVESDVAQHAVQVIADGRPRHLHYGMGSPWIDIKLRCGGAIHIVVERVPADSEAARALIARMRARQPALWISDGAEARVEDAETADLLTLTQQPFAIARRFDPRRRLIVSGWDPTAMAIAKLGADAQFETYLVREGGPETPPPIEGVDYLRMSAEQALTRLGLDGWTAFVGATHDSDLDLPACAAALKAGAGYVGLLGAASRVPEREAGIIAAGAPPETLKNLYAPAGMLRLGKAPWRIAIGIVAEVLQVMTGEQARA